MFFAPKHLSKSMEKHHSISPSQQKSKDIDCQFCCWMLSDVVGIHGKRPSESQAQNIYRAFEHAKAHGNYPLIVRRCSYGMGHGFKIVQRFQKCCGRGLYFSIQLSSLNFPCSCHGRIWTNEGRRSQEEAKGIRG